MQNSISITKYKKEKKIFNNKKKGLQENPIREKITEHKK